MCEDDSDFLTNGKNQNPLYSGASNRDNKFPATLYVEQIVIEIEALVFIAEVSVEKYFRRSS